jgi:hypothetical protein
MFVLPASPCLSLPLSLFVSSLSLALSQGDCPYKDESEYREGSFDFLPYQYIIGLGVVTFLYSSLFALYYLLPVDENSRKYVPGLTLLSSLPSSPLPFTGLRQLIEKFLSPADINAYHHMSVLVSPPRSLL